jgi:hypothetical protein
MSGETRNPAEELKMWIIEDEHETTNFNELVGFREHL